jgi:hypothetical protein
MSNLFSTVSNYSGRQPDNVQNIKQFVTNISNQVVWIYKRLASGMTVITIGDQNKNVLIPLDLYVNGSLFNPSDENLKTNISFLSSEKNNSLLNLNPVEFEYKSDLRKKPHFGLIAQDVEKIFPELVSSDVMGYKTVNYIELIPVILSKMRYMQEEINELKKMNTIKKDDV